VLSCCHLILFLIKPRPRTNSRSPCLAGIDPSFSLLDLRQTSNVNTTTTHFVPTLHSVIRWHTPTIHNLAPPHAGSTCSPQVNTNIPSLGRLAYKNIEDAQTRAKDHTKPHLLGWLEDADSYTYQVDDHRFAITIDPSRIGPLMANLIRDEAHTSLCVDDLSLFIDMLRQTSGKDDLSISISICLQRLVKDVPRTLGHGVYLPDNVLDPGE
jgi:hypothetical protein